MIHLQVLFLPLAENVVLVVAVHHCYKNIFSKLNNSKRFVIYLHGTSHHKSSLLVITLNGALANVDLVLSHLDFRAQ